MKSVEIDSFSECMANMWFGGIIGIKLEYKWLTKAKYGGVNGENVGKKLKA